MKKYSDIPSLKQAAIPSYSPAKHSTLSDGMRESKRQKSFSRGLKCNSPAIYLLKKILHNINPLTFVLKHIQQKKTLFYLSVV